MVYVSKLFLIFLFCSFFGWVMEVIVGKNTKNKFINRGFLVGPICPIYGFGALLMYFLLNSFKYDSILVWILGMAIASILEYLTSLVLEKIFGICLWDYSGVKLNINGRISIEAMGLFGTLGLILIYFIFPFSISIMSYMDKYFLVGLSITLFLILLVDIFISTRIISKHKNTNSKIKYDMTEEISLYVKGTVSDLIFVNGIIWNFPNIKLDFRKLGKFKSRD